MDRILVGVAGQLHAGKSTFANALKESFLEHGGCSVESLPFAGPLKQCARTFFGWDGEKDEAGRRLLQGLGTDVGRAYNPDVWVDAWQDSLYASKADVVIVDDVRFDNEVFRIQKLGGRVYWLGRNGYLPPGGQDISHVSENGIQNASIDGELWFDSGDVKGIETWACIVALKELLAHAKRCKGACGHHEELKERSKDASALLRWLRNNSSEVKELLAHAKKCKGAYGHHEELKERSKDIRGPDNPRPFVLRNPNYDEIVKHPCALAFFSSVMVFESGDIYCPTCWPAELACLYGHPWED